MKYSILMVAALAAVQAFGQEPAQKPLIDNDRVTVWDGVPASPNRTLDAVLIYVVEGSPLTIGAQFEQKVAAVPVNTIGGLIIDATGSAGTSKSSLRLPPTGTKRTLRIELKDKKVDPIPNPTGLPPAFPRPGIFQLMDNDRVTVWDYTWTLNEPTPMHFHDKDVVVMFLENGTLMSTTQTGEKTNNDYLPGTVRFNARDRAHNETLTRGQQRAVIVELK